jgi:metallo-beta-lactamase class B
MFRLFFYSIILAGLGLGLSACDPVRVLIIQNELSQPVQLKMVPQPGSPFFADVSEDTLSLSLSARGDSSRHVWYYGLGGWSKQDLQQLQDSFLSYLSLTTPSDTFVSAQKGEISALLPTEREGPFQALLQIRLQPGLFAPPPLALGKPQQLSEDLQVQQLTENLWIHRSWMSLAPYGRFYSNGLVLVSQGKCLVFDSPVTDSLSRQLLDWVQQQGWSPKGVVVNHFHEDCLGGLEAFHEQSIPSYANGKTRLLAKKQGFPIPQQGFHRKRKLKLGSQEVELFFPGPAHTADNIVAWIPAEKTLFGGCMVKSLGSGEGNLADASPADWSATIETVKRKYGTKARWVIPGHGPVGGPELLDYSIRMFASD